MSSSKEIWIDIPALVERAFHTFDDVNTPHGILESTVRFIEKHGNEEHRTRLKTLLTEHVILQRRIFQLGRVQMATRTYPWEN